MTLQERPATSFADGEILGPAAIIGTAYRHGDLGQLARVRAERFDATGDPAALLDLAFILQALGDEGAAEGLTLMKQALSLRKDYTIRHGDGTGPRLLVLATAGNFMANSPVDLLFEGSNWTLLLRYIDPQTPTLDDLPDHDAAFLAVGEGADNIAVHERLVDLLAAYARPVVNGVPHRIAALTRDGVSARFAGLPGVVYPQTRRVGRADLGWPADQQPMILRPVGTHAGNGLARIDSEAELSAYLADTEGETFYVAPFVDFRSTDGQYRKDRVVFIRGRAYPVHHAISDHWLIHYLNAGMADSAAKRAEEEAWFDSFDTGYGARHAAAFAAMVEEMGLDYFGIDCAELPDGRLLVFETDVAMVVHDMEPPDVFPYKSRHMARLFDAFRSMCLEVADAG